MYIFNTVIDLIIDYSNSVYKNIWMPPSIMHMCVCAFDYSSSGPEKAT